jgi:hypothetical protein
MKINLSLPLNIFIGCVMKKDIKRLGLHQSPLVSTAVVVVA